MDRWFVPTILMVSVTTPNQLYNAVTVHAADCNNLKIWANWVWGVGGGLELEVLNNKRQDLGQMTNQSSALKLRSKISNNLCTFSFVCCFKWKLLSTVY